MYKFPKEGDFTEKTLNMQTIQTYFNATQVEMTAEYILEIANKERLKFKDGSFERVFIGGHSQGAIVSLAAFLKHTGPQHLGGIIALSGFVGVNAPPMSLDQAKLHSETPLYLYHGKRDALLPIELARYTYTNLQSKFYSRPQFRSNFSLLVSEYGTHDMDELGTSTMFSWLDKLRQ